MLEEESYIMKVRKMGVTNTTKRNLYMWMAWPYRLFDAIRQVETGGHEDPRNAVGDNGLSIGPYQIQKAYWQDAIEAHPEIGGQYLHVKDARYAERIMLAYWDRYAPNDSYETLARIHNGGPKGHEKAATLDYWNKVSSHLK